LHYYISQGVAALSKTSLPWEIELSFADSYKNLLVGTWEFAANRRLCEPTLKREGVRAYINQGHLVNVFGKA